MPCGPSAEFPAETPAQMRARIRELEAQLAEAHGDLAKARDAWEMRGVGHGWVALSEYDGSAQKMRDALRGPELRALKTVTPPTGGG